MLSPVIFENVDLAIFALDRLFPGLEAVIHDGSLGCQVGIFQTKEGGKGPWERYPVGTSIYSFLLDTLPGDCECPEQVTGVRIGVRGEFCGSAEDGKAFKEMALSRRGIWELRRVL